MKKSDFNVIILTVQRPNKTDYLGRIIKSIRQDYDGPIHLVIGGKETAYTDKYKEPDYIKHYNGEEEAKLSTVIKKAACGYVRCLNIDKTKPCIIFEEDGVLDKDWYKRLKELITFIPYEKYILSLLPPSDGSVPYPNIDIPSVQGFLYHSYLDYKEPGELPLATIITYCNTTGIYYPVSILNTRVAEFIHKFAVEGDTVHDLALGQFMFRYNLPIQITVPHLLLDVDSEDSSLGADKRRSHIDYSQWNYKQP